MTDALDQYATSAKQLTLGELQRLQVAHDESYWSAPKEYGSKRRHILFHLIGAVGKLARLEERTDHAAPGDERVITEVAADLQIFAAQLADLGNVGLQDVYLERLSELRDRFRST